MEIQTVPNMINWSKSDVMKVAELLELKLNMVGSGYVTKQNIQPTSPVKKGDHLVVNFQSTEQTIKQKSKVEKKERRRHSSRLKDS